MNESKDELDLVAIIKKIKLHIQFNKLLYLKSFLTSFIVSSIILITYYKIKPAKFRSKLTGYSQWLSYEENEAILMSLNQLAEEENSVELGKLLNISSENAKKIKSFKSNRLMEMARVVQKDASPLINEQNEIEKDILIDKFEIEIVVEDVSIFDTLNTKLANYINNIPYNKQLTDNNTIEYRKKIEKATKEISNLDSVKNTYFSSLKPAGTSKSNAVNVYALNPSDLNLAVFEIFEKKVLCEKRIQENKGFHVINKFINSSKPINKSKILLLFAIIVCTVLLGLLFSTSVKLIRI